MNKGCNYKDCLQKHYGKGFCEKHYNKLRGTGIVGSKNKCKIKNCSNFVLKRGLCKKHEVRDRVSKNEKNKIKCSVEGCEHFRYTSQLCNAHMSQRAMNNPESYLVKKYHSMKDRVQGKVKNGIHLYKGLDILSKEDFIKWALQDLKFKELFANYIASGKVLRLAPSIERINPELGYTLDNIEFITFSENSIRANHTRKRFKVLKTCTIGNCLNKYYAKNMCRRHYDVQLKRKIRQNK